MVGRIRRVIKLEKMIPPADRTSIGACFPLPVTGKVKAMLARQLCHKFGCRYHRLANGAKRTGGWSYGLDAQHGFTIKPKKKQHHLNEDVPPTYQTQRCRNAVIHVRWGRVQLIGFDVNQGPGKGQARKSIDYT